MVRKTGMSKRLRKQKADDIQENHLKEHLATLTSDELRIWRDSLNTNHSGVEYYKENLKYVLEEIKLRKEK